MKKKPAALTIDLIKSLPVHPRHHDFLNAAIKLLATAVMNEVSLEAPVTEEEAMAGARAEFQTGVAALAFIPDDDCFHFVWSSAAWSQTLKHYVVKAWEQEPGAYGSKPPVHHDPKRGSIKLH